MTQCIYKIICKVTGKFYLGSTLNLHKRKRRHLYDLRSGNHHSVHLQRAYDKYGIESLEFHIVSKVDDSLLLRKMEQELLDTLDFSTCYNTSRSASGGDLISYNPNRDSIVEKMTSSLITKYSTMSEEDRKTTYGRVGSTNPNWKGGISRSYCGCGTRKTVSAKTCSKCRDRTGMNNPFHGKKHSVETIGRITASNSKRVSIHGVTYCSVAEASRLLGIPENTIRTRVRSVRNTDYYLLKEECND